MPRIDLEILGRTYPFSVAEEEADTLRAAAEILNNRAAKFRKADRSLIGERIAIMTALEIAFESLTGRLGITPEQEEGMERMAQLSMRCEEMLRG